VGKDHDVKNFKYYNSIALLLGYHSLELTFYFLILSIHSLVSSLVFVRHCLLMVSVGMLPAIPRCLGWLDEWEWERKGINCSMAKREWDLSFRWELDGNENEVTEMVGIWY